MAINKLTALNRGNPLNSNGAQLVESVNCIIDEIETSLPAAIDAVSVRTTTLEGDVTNIETEIADLDNQFIKLEEEINLEAQSKASFLANAEQRKRDYAGSGFAEWGRQFNGELSVDWENINEGLFTLNTLASTLFVGRGASDKVGSSRTDNALAIVDGTQHNIYGTAYLGANEPTSISFSPAPDGTVTYDSATGVVTEHASAAEAFNERKDTSPIVTADVTWDADINTLSFTAPSLGGASFPTGKPTGNSKFILTIESSENNVIQLRDSASNSGSSPLIVAKSTSAGKITRFEGTYTATSTGIYIRVTNPQAGQTIKIHSLQVLTSTESVITSRKDLVFLETWHEAISDKDQVYPLGNVQYDATTYEGMTLATRNDGYTRFGEWDTTTTGRYSVWSTLTDAQKRVYINDPENNIYYDSDADELIQVRYRVRVIEGLGDAWDNVVANELGDFSYSAAGNTNVGVRGSATNIIEYVSGTSTARYTDTQATSGAESEIGRFVPFTAQNSHTTCFAVPIALVQRLNQGAYHPTYNSMGCRSWVASGLGFANKWFANFNEPITSTSQCFEPQVISDRPKPTQFSGRIVTNVTGRSDQYKYYDAIYAGQVEDLRLNANKLDVNQLREESMRKAVAGEMRGKGKVPFTQVQQATQGATGSATTTFDGLNNTNISVGDKAWLENASSVYERVTITSVNISGTIGFEPSLSGRLADSMAVLERELSPEFDSLPWVDIIGDPERIAATFPDGVVGQWIPQIPDNNSQDFIFNQKANGEVRRQFTADDGATWVSGGITEDFINNEYTWAANALNVAVLSYESLSNFTEPSNNSVVVGDVGDVIFTDGYTVETGNRLQPSLTGEIGKDDTAGNFNRNVKMQYHFIEDGEFSTDVALDNKHIELPEFIPANDSPAVKALSTVTNKDGLLYLQLHGSELVYDGGSATRWGDDEIIPIVDGENTKTDLNGTTVKTFCHHTQIPLGITNYNKTTT